MTREELRQEIEKEVGTYTKDYKHQQYIAVDTSVETVEIDIFRSEEVILCEDFKTVTATIKEYFDTNTKRTLVGGKKESNGAMESTAHVTRANGFKGKVIFLNYSEAKGITCQEH